MTSSRSRTVVFEVTQIVPPVTATMLVPTAVPPPGYESVAAVGVGASQRWTTRKPRDGAPLAISRTMTPDVVAATPVRLSTRTVCVDHADRLLPLRAVSNAFAGAMNCQPPPAGGPELVDGAAGAVAGVEAGAVVVGGVAATVTWPSVGGTVPSGCGSGSLFLQPSTALTEAVGLIDAPPLGWISKCRCGLPALPVAPTYPMNWPATTFEPTFSPGANAARCA
jgi:hypothetical protein